MVQASNSLTDIPSNENTEHELKGLYPGSRFQGTQRSGRSSYEVEVELQDVDIERQVLCELLR